MTRYSFDDREGFLEKLRDLVGEGVPKENITTLTPFHVHEVDAIMGGGTSPVRIFALFGALTGLTAGFAFTIYTVKVWPLISGGKPLVAIPAFLIIAFALTILFGSLSSLAGFLLLARLPSPRNMGPEGLFSDRYEILVEEENERA